MSVPGGNPQEVAPPSRQTLPQWTDRHFWKHYLPLWSVKISFLKYCTVSCIVAGRLTSSSCGSFSSLKFGISMEPSKVSSLSFFEPVEKNTEILIPTSEHREHWFCMKVPFPFLRFVFTWFVGKSKYHLDWVLKSVMFFEVQRFFEMKTHFISITFLTFPIGFYFPLVKEYKFGFSIVCRSLPFTFFQLCDLT